MLVQCPRCRAEIEYSVTNKFRPFCSERCQLIDLGQWAEGGYAIPVEKSDEVNLLLEDLLEDEERNLETPDHVSEGYEVQPKATPKGKKARTSGARSNVSFDADEAHKSQSQSQSQSQTCTDNQEDPDDSLQ